MVSRLKETAHSIQAACDSVCGVRAIVVANDEVDIGVLPPCFDVMRVKLKAPSVSVFRGETEEVTRASAVRWDKGFKVASGMLEAKKAGSRFVMSVDADDLVASSIAQLPAMFPESNGWFVRQGWLLPVHSHWGVLLDDFQNWCGTYAMIRTDLLPLPDDLGALPPVVVRSLFGHHRDLLPFLAEQSTPLEPMPFRAAVYRIGHPDGNYGRASLTSGVLDPRHLVAQPRDFLRWLSRLRFFGAREKARFFGRAD